MIAALDGRPVLFNHVAGSEFRVLSGQCSDRRYFALALGCPVEELVFRLADAYQAPQPPPLVARADAPCQQVVMPAVDLLRLPFLTHYAGDAGPYATAAIAIVNDPDSGPNVSFHRCLRLDSTRLAARIVERRGTDTALKKTPTTCRWPSASACRCTCCWPPAWRPTPAWTSWPSPTPWRPRRWSSA